MFLHLPNDSMPKVWTYDILSKHTVLRHNVFTNMFTLFCSIVIFLMFLFNCECKNTEFSWEPINYSLTFLNDLSSCCILSNFSKQSSKHSSLHEACKGVPYLHEYIAWTYYGKDDCTFVCLSFVIYSTQWYWQEFSFYFYSLFVRFLSL